MPLPSPPPAPSLPLAGYAWQLCWLCSATAYITALLPGGPAALISLAAFTGSLGGFISSYSCLMRLQPLLLRLGNSEASARAVPRGQALVRSGKSG